MPIAPLYPEHEKLTALNGANQIVGDFIEWLNEKGFVIALWATDTDLLYPTMQSRDALIAQHFDIDPSKLEAEKQQILAFFRNPA